MFLDEFPEFGTRVLEVMRQLMEDKVVTISRAKGSLTFSANFQLIAAMNSCPCGYYGDAMKPCSCAHALVTKYQKRISGPLLDRIDIHIEVPRVDYEKLSGDRVGEIELENPLSVLEQGCKLRGLSKTIVFRGTAHRTLFVMPICVWGRSGSIVGWEKKDRA